MLSYSFSVFATYEETLALIVDILIPTSPAYGKVSEFDTSRIVVVRLKISLSQ